MAEKIDRWTREQLLIAFNLYCQMPFGKMHARNPGIVRIAGSIGRTPSALAMKLTNIASLDPAITSTGRAGLKAASEADKAMWNEMQNDWESFALTSQLAIDSLEGDAHLELDAALATPASSESDQTDYASENRTAQTQVRIGQQFFRRAVISAYQGRCCITGLAEPSLLVASHIVPWRHDKANRLNPGNGLCLSVLHDKAFDQGLFTLTTKFKIQTSKRIKEMSGKPFAEDWLVKLEGRAIDLPQKFGPLKQFMDWHNENIFLA